MSLSYRVSKLARRQQPAQFSELVQISAEIRQLEDFIDLVESRMVDMGGSFQADDAAWRIQIALDKLRGKK